MLLLCISLSFQSWVKGEITGKETEKEMIKAMVLRGVSGEWINALESGFGTRQVC